MSDKHSIMIVDDVNKETVIKVRIGDNKYNPTIPSTKTRIITDGLTVERPNKPTSRRDRMRQQKKLLTSENTVPKDSN